MVERRCHSKSGANREKVVYRIDRLSGDCGYGREFFYYKPR